MISEHISFSAQIFLMAKENGFHTKSNSNTCDEDDFRKHLKITNI